MQTNVVSLLLKRHAPVPLPGAAHKGYGHLTGGLVALGDNDVLFESGTANGALVYLDEAVRADAEVSPSLARRRPRT